MPLSKRPYLWTGANWLSWKRYFCHFLCIFTTLFGSIMYRSTCPKAAIIWFSGSFPLAVLDKLTRVAVSRISTFAIGKGSCGPDVRQAKSKVRNFKIMERWFRIGGFLIYMWSFLSVRQCCGRRRSCRCIEFWQLSIQPISRYLPLEILRNCRVSTCL